MDYNTSGKNDFSVARNSPDWITWRPQKFDPFAFKEVKRSVHIFCRNIVEGVFSTAIEVG